MFRLSPSVFGLFSALLASPSFAQTPAAMPGPQAAPMQLSKPATNSAQVNQDDLVSLNSAQSVSFEPAPFVDAYELGFIEPDASADKPDLTQEELAKIKKSFDVPKSKDNPRYKPVFNIRAGEEKPEWQKGDYYPAGR